MARKTAPLLLPTEKLLHQFGERLRLARLRRRLPAKQVAARAGMTPMTLRGLERGGAGVTLGAYLSVMQVLGMEKDLDLLGQADPLGRELQDSRYPAQGKSAGNVLARYSSSASSNPSQTYPQLNDPPSEQRHQAPEVGAVERLHSPAMQIKNNLKLTTDSRAWIDKGGFASSQELANLIDYGKSVTRKKKR